MSLSLNVLNHLSLSFSVLNHPGLSFSVLNHLSLSFSVLNHLNLCFSVIKVMFFFSKTTQPLAIEIGETIPESVVSDVLNEQ